MNHRILDQWGEYLNIFVTLSGCYSSEGVFLPLQLSLCSVICCLRVRKTPRMNAVEWFNIFHGRKLCSCLCIIGWWRLIVGAWDLKKGFFMERLLRMASLWLEPETHNISSSWFQPLLWSISFLGKSKNEGSRDDLAYFMDMSSMIASEQEEDEG